MSRKITVNDTLEMSVPERLQLVQDLWDSIAADPRGVPISDATRAEVERRLDEHERNPGDTVPWAEVKRQILGNT